MKIEKQILKVTKFIKFIVTISITISGLFIFGCIGGFEKGYMAITQFILYLLCSLLVTFIVSALYVLLDKFQKYIEKSIHAYYTRKRKKFMTHKTQALKRSAL